jgi:hypothetical protein
MIRLSYNICLEVKVANYKKYFKVNMAPGNYVF